MNDPGNIGTKEPESFNFFFKPNRLQEIIWNYHNIPLNPFNWQRIHFLRSPKLLTIQCVRKGIRQILFGTRLRVPPNANMALFSSLIGQDSFSERAPLCLMQTMSALCHNYNLLFIWSENKGSRLPWLLYSQPFSFEFSAYDPSVFKTNRGNHLLKERGLEARDQHTGQPPLPQQLHGQWRLDLLSACWSTPSVGRSQIESGPSTRGQFKKRWRVPPAEHRQTVRRQCQNKRTNNRDETPIADDFALGG